MIRFEIESNEFSDSETMAAAYLSEYFENQKIEYPINPFQMLKDEGILFSLMDFKNLEGVYIPAGNNEDIPVVGINVNRPITRQRFTAAHELCHHFRDANKQISCPIYGKKNEIEKFADGFAAALLMPMQELQLQVDKRKNSYGNVSFDDVLEIADFFGVSFNSCLFRIAYKTYAIEGDTESDELQKRANEYSPEKVRKSRHLTYTKLFEGLIDCYQEQLALPHLDFARNIFQNNYIYNDSRMEGLRVTHEQATEIVTDIRLKTQNSEYYNEACEAYMSIAGHYDMYKDIFAEPTKDTLSIFDILLLNRKLFSYYPNPDFGGSIRKNNVLVLGAKFETTDYHDIFTELGELDIEVRDYFARRKNISMSEYLKHVVRTHHRITVIHPFSEGNGRTARAFMNVQLVRAGMIPVYIKVEDKKAYINALTRADIFQDYDELYEMIFKLVFRSYVELRLQ